MASGFGARRAWTIAILFAAIAAGLGWFAWRALGPGASGQSIANASAARIAAGDAIYRQHCASCHGAELQGEPNWRQRKASGRLPAPPHDDSGHTWHHPDAVLFEITRNGLKPPLAPDGYESDMPGFGAVLGDEQIWSVLAYIGSRWSPREKQHQARVDAAHRRAQ